MPERGEALLRVFDAARRFRRQFVQAAGEYEMALSNSEDCLDAEETAEKWLLDLSGDLPLILNFINHAWAGDPRFASLQTLRRDWTNVLGEHGRESTVIEALRQLISEVATAVGEEASGAPTDPSMIGIEDAVKLATSFCSQRLEWRLLYENLPLGAVGEPPTASQVDAIRDAKLKAASCQETAFKLIHVAQSWFGKDYEDVAAAVRTFDWRSPDSEAVDALERIAESVRTHAFEAAASHLAVPPLAGQTESLADVIEAVDRVREATEDAGTLRELEVSQHATTAAEEQSMDARWEFNFYQLRRYVPTLIAFARREGIESAIRSLEGFREDHPLAMEILLEHGGSNPLWDDKLLGHVAQEISQVSTRASWLRSSWLVRNPDQFRDHGEDGSDDDREMGNGGTDGIDSYNSSDRAPVPRLNLDKSPPVNQSDTGQGMLALDHRQVAAIVERGTQPGRKPLVGKAARAAAYIDANPGCAAKNIAKHIEVDSIQHFHRTYGPRLRAHGYRHVNDGYYPPDTSSPDSAT